MPASDGWTPLVGDHPLRSRATEQAASSSSSSMASTSKRRQLKITRRRINCLVPCSRSCLLRVIRSPIANRKRYRMSFRNWVRFVRSFSTKISVTLLNSSCLGLKLFLMTSVANGGFSTAVTLMLKREIGPHVVRWPGRRRPTDAPPDRSPPPPPPKFNLGCLILMRSEERARYSRGVPPAHVLYAYAYVSGDANKPPGMEQETSAVSQHGFH